MKVFDELRNLYSEKEQNNLVIFVGAGISENYANIKDGKKFPSWKTLVESLTLDDMDKNTTVDSLKTAQIFQDNYSKEALAYKVKELFPQDYDSHKIHQLIFDLEPAHVLTTNYDHLLEKALQVNGFDNKYHIIDADEAIPLSKAKQNLLVKAHGDICRGNIVLSEQDYNEYEQKFPLILSFIRYVFSKYKVLFIGFSLSDPNFNKILFWVKNILDENSIQHTVILHNDISESERIYFEKKSVRVLTKNEIIGSIFDQNNIENANQLYLIESLEFIKDGYPKRLYTITDRFNILKKNLQHVRYFNYLLPEITSSFFENTELEFSYYEFAESLKSDGKKEKRYSWLANIYSNDGNFNLIKAIEDDAEKIDKNFYVEYINDLIKIFLLSNIGSISYSNYPDVQKIFLKQFNNGYILPENSEYTLTYQLESNEISYLDKSFEKNSPYYDELCFLKEDFFIYYLLGNKQTAYHLFKKGSHIDLCEKYFYYFRLYYLQNGTSEYKDYKKITESIFLSMNKYSQKVFTPLHRIQFVQSFIDYCMKSKQNYEEYKNRGNREFGGWDRKDLYQISFYIQYSRFLKFIFLNKLPILSDNRVTTAIHLANQFYFNDFFQIRDNKVDISNWILFGIALDNKPKEIREIIVKFHNDLFAKKIEFEFDIPYIKNLLLANINTKKTDKCLIHFENIFYIMGLFSANKAIFDMSLDVFLQYIKFDIKNIEFYSEALHIALINFKKSQNEFDELQIHTIKEILNSYIDFKLDNKRIHIKEEKFRDIVWALKKDIFDEQNNNVYQTIKGWDVEFNNLNLFLRVLWLLGYKLFDIAEIVNQIKESFERDDFYSSQNNLQNEIENAILTLYLLYDEDLGLEKIKDYYLEILKKNMKESGYSSNVGVAFEWLNLFIDNKIYKDDILNELENEDLFDRFIKQLMQLAATNATDIFGWGKSILEYGLYLFIKLGKFDKIDGKFGELFSNIEVISLLANKVLIEEYSDNLICFLEKLSEFNNKAFIVSLHALIDAYIRDDMAINDLLIIYTGMIKEYSQKLI